MVIVTFYVSLTQFCRASHKHCCLHSVNRGVFSLYCLGSNLFRKLASEMNDEPNQSEIDDSEFPEDGVELSLDELGRAYAKAVGLIPDEPAAAEPDALPEVVDDDAACELSPRSILEAMLFMGSPDADSPLTTRKVASWIRDVSPKEVTELAKHLQEEYEEQGMAIRIERDRQRLKLVLDPEFEPVRESFYGEVRKARLSQQAIDVLAIVAYKQPATKERVSDARGRDCGSILNQLTKRKLLQVDRDPENARVRLFSTTDRFLELFGLDSLEDLPQAEDILPPEFEDL